MEFKKYLNKSKIISVFFILMFVGSVFSANLDPERFQEKINNDCTNCKDNKTVLNFAKDKQNNKQVQDFGSGCYTKALSEESVEKLWDEILTEGFRAGRIVSDQPQNKNREETTNKDVLLTKKGTEANDAVLKKEMPSKKIKPKEIPTILGQTCYGPFSYSINLEKTFRAGRCDPNYPQEPCYLEDEGLFRKNGNNSFTEETMSVGKDIINTFIDSKTGEYTEKEIKKLTNDPDKNINPIELGLFSDMSYHQLKDFRETMYDENTENIELKTMKRYKDKAIENSYKSESFNVGMETTCDSQNCYINLYSLFDKMFNQYFSFDLVVSAGSPMLMNATRSFVPKTKFSKIAGKEIKEGSMIDDIVNKKLSLRKSVLNKNLKRKYGKNLDKYTKQLENVKTKRLNLLKEHDVEKEGKDILKAISDGDAAEEIIKKKLARGGEYAKLNKAQKRILTDMMYEEQKYMNVTKNIMSSLTDDSVYKNAIKKYESGISEGLSPGQIKANMTKAEYNKIINVTKNRQKLMKSHTDSTLEGFKWDKGIEDLSVAKSRTYKPNIANEKIEITPRVQSAKHEGVTGTVSSKELVGKNSYVMKQADDGTYSVKSASNMKTKTVEETLADGTTIRTEKILPTKVSIDKSTDASRYLSRNQVQEFSKTNADKYIGYTDAAGEYRLMPSTQFSVDNVDGSITNFYYHNVERKVLDNTDQIKEYGIDPMELAYQYEDLMGNQKFKKAVENVDNISDTMKAKGWSTGKGINWLNKKLKEQKSGKYMNRKFNFLIDTFESYGYSWVYWSSKQAGQNLDFVPNGLEKYSTYMIPENYSKLNIEHKNSKIYSDSYIDFFANDGSDQGDLFMKFLNSWLFWGQEIIKAGLETTNWGPLESANDWIKKVTEGVIRRNQTDDIVVLTDAENVNCGDNCYVKVSDNSILSKQTQEKSINKETKKEDIKLDEVNLALNTPSNISLVNYILENTKPENKKEEGITLISFSHHTDYSGTLNQATNNQDGIDLEKARNQENTCKDSLENLELLGVPIGKVLSPALGKSYRVGGALALLSNVVYISLPAPSHVSIMGAIFGDLVPQLLIMPEIQGCVDDQEGYYAHIFVGQEEFERQKNDPKHKLGEMVEKGTESVEKTLKGMAKNTGAEEKISAGANQVKSFAQKNLKKDPIVQARMETTSNTSGSLSGDLFFFELGSNSSCRASADIDKGVENLEDDKTQKTVTADREKGELTVKDNKTGEVKEIIGEDQKEYVRLMATNLNIPAKVIPHKLSYIPISDNINQTMFEIDVYGNLTVEDKELLECLRSNYKAQTGLELKGDTLTEYIGPVKTAITTNKLNPKTQYDLIPRGLNGKTEILAEGTPRKSAKGENAKIEIKGDRTTNLSPINGEKQSLGKNISIQFERGQLIYLGEKDSYVMWVEQTSKMHQSEISDMKTKVTSYENPETGCEEFALDMSVKAKDTPKARKNADKMNKALENVGPFQMFETDKKTFIFYTGKPPECEKRMKIIDKETGEVITDQKIDSIQETPNGMKVRTEDGKEHDFEFSAKDGIPKVKYNGETQTLKSAQGKNGSFYYDPKTGNWNTENGHMIPFDPEFKEGMMFKSNEDGKVEGTPGQNPMNINIGGDSKNSGSGFNVPLTPKKLNSIILYLLVIVTGFLFIYNRKKKQN